MAVRAPQLNHVLRAFTLGAFAYLLRELDEGGELPVAFVEHEHGRGPALYEYRPLVRSFIEERAARLRAREDAVLALEELHREPAAAIFARAHAGPRPSADEALFRTVLLGLLVSTAEACGGFDWDDDAFDRAYGELERSLFGERRDVRGGCPARRDLGRDAARAGSRAANPVGGRRRAGAALARGELARAERLRSRGGPLLRARAARRPSREAEEPPDAPAEIADAVSAIRLATAAPLSAGPVIFETLDGRPFGIRPVLPIAATQPPGEPSRLDTFRGGLAAELLVRLGLADADTALAEALDRWELSLFQHDPFRSEQLRASLSALFGDTWPLRAAVLLEDEPESRGRHSTPSSPRWPQATAASAVAADATRRALVDVLQHSDRAALVRELDGALLGTERRRGIHVAV